MILTRYPSKNIDFIDIRGEILSSTERIIISSYNHTLKATPVQDVFGREMILKLISTVYHQFIIAITQ